MDPPLKKSDSGRTVVGIQDLSGMPMYFSISQKTKMQQLFAV
jgi:hypothetical protein